MDSIYEFIGRLQVTYWTTSILGGLSRKSHYPVVYKTAYTRADTNHLKTWLCFIQLVASKKEKYRYIPRHKTHYKLALLNQLEWYVFSNVVWLLFALATHPWTSHVVIYVFCRIKIASSEILRQKLFRYFRFSKSVKSFKTASELLPDCFSFWLSFA